MDQKTLSKLHEIETNILKEIVRICEENNLTYMLIGGTLLGAIRHKGFIPWDDDLDIAMPRKSYDKFLEICKRDLNSQYSLDYHTNNKYYWLPFAKIRRKGTVYEEAFLRNNDNIPKGVWVDIFPLDSVMKEKSILQTLQAKLVFSLSILIRYKLGYARPQKKTTKIMFNLFKFMSINKLFSIQEKIMTVWNREEAEYFVNLGSKYGYKKQTILKEKYLPTVKVEFEGNFFNAPKDWEFILKRIYGDYMKLPPKEERVTHDPVRIDLGE